MATILEIYLILSNWLSVERSRSLKDHIVIFFQIFVDVISFCHFLQYGRIRLI